MTKRDVLLLLKELIQEACHVQGSSSDDPSGINTTYLVDQERLLENIERKLTEEPT